MSVWVHGYGYSIIVCILYGIVTFLDIFDLLYTYTLHMEQICPRDNLTKKKLLRKLAKTTLFLKYLFFDFNIY